MGIVRDEPYIIAECGVNWEADRNMAYRMIRRARNAGADAVKFQCFDGSVVDDESLLKYSLDLQQAIRFREQAQKMGLEFLCTPMYPEAVEMLAPHVDRWKIRAADGPDSEVAKQLFDALNPGSKSIINSTSKYNYTDSKLVSGGDNGTHVLYCVPEYPTDKMHLRYEIMEQLDGFSCHCPDMEIWPTVADTDPEIVEVHVTPDKDGTHPDDDVSYEFDQLAQIVEILES